MGGQIGQFRENIPQEIRTITFTLFSLYGRKPWSGLAKCGHAEHGSGAHLLALLEALEGLRRDTELTANADCSEPAALDLPAHRARADRPTGGQCVNGPVTALNPFAISLRSAGMAAGDC